MARERHHGRGQHERRGDQRRTQVKHSDGAIEPGQHGERAEHDHREQERDGNEQRPDQPADRARPTPTEPGGREDQRGRDARDETVRVLDHRVHLGRGDDATVAARPVGAPRDRFRGADDAAHRDEQGGYGCCHDDQVAVATGDEITVCGSGGLSTLPH